MIKELKKYTFLVLVLLVSICFSQNIEKQQLKAQRTAQNFVYEANSYVEKEDFVAAEMEYRKAISKQETNIAGTYNLAHSYYKKGSFAEALFRSQEAAKNAVSKVDKHKAFHNIGNILMQNKKCKEAVEAFKSALRNNPNDEETRYNFALAKECAEDQKQDGGGEDDKEDENKDKENEKDKKDQDKKEDENQDQKDKKEKEDEGDKDKKKGEDEEDKDGKPKDDKKDEGKGDKEKNDQKPKPQPGKMSPQQVKNILEAMNNQEQKVQEKINANKQKGARVKTEKDW